MQHVRNVQAAVALPDPPMGGVSEPDTYTNDSNWTHNLNMCVIKKKTDINLLLMAGFALWNITEILVSEVFNVTIHHSANSYWAKRCLMIPCTVEFHWYYADTMSSKHFTDLTQAVHAPLYSFFLFYSKVFINSDDLWNFSQGQRRKEQREPTACQCKITTFFRKTLMIIFVSLPFGLDYVSLLHTALFLLTLILHKCNVDEFMKFEKYKS